MTKRNIDGRKNKDDPKFSLLSDSKDSAPLTERGNTEVVRS